MCRLIFLLKEKIFLNTKVFHSVFVCVCVPVQIGVYFNVFVLYAKSIQANEKVKIYFDLIS